MRKCIALRRRTRAVSQRLASDPDLLSRVACDEQELKEFLDVDDVTDALTEITASFCTDQSALDVIVQAINSAFNSEALQHSVSDSLCTLFVLRVFMTVGNAPCM